MFGARQTRATGIHLGDQALHIVELACRKGEMALHNLVREPLPAAFAVAQLASDEARRELAQFVRQVGAEHGLRFKRTCLALDHSAFLLKRRPWICGDEQANREHLKWEAQQVLPDRVEEYALDFVRTSHGYFLVAARRRLLRLYAALCREAGMARPVFDIAPFALYNALEASGSLSGEGVELLVDLSPAEAIILLLNGGQLQAVSSCRWEEAAGEPASRLEALAEKIHHLLDLESGTRRPQRLWLSGPAVEDPVWEAGLRSKLAAEAQLLDPFQGVEEALLAEDFPAKGVFAVAAGLAYRRLSRED